MTPPLATPTPPSRPPQRWRWPTTPSKAPAVAGGWDSLGPPPCARSPIPLFSSLRRLPACARPFQVLLFLQEEEEKISAATQVTPGRWPLKPPSAAPRGPLFHGRVATAGCRLQARQSCQPPRGVTSFT